MPAVIPALVIGGATVASAVIQKNAVDKATKAQTKAAATNAQTAKDTAATNQASIDKTKAENDALFKSFIDRGNNAGDAINNFLGLNGTTTQNHAFDAYKDSTGYQFQLQSGSDAIASNKAASGMLKSGSALKALDKYGQDVASTYTQNYLSNLGSQQSAGLNAASNNASSNSTATGQTVNNNNNALGVITNSNTNAANATAQGATDSANALTNLLGNAVSAYNYNKGSSSYGTGASSTPSAISKARNWAP